MKAKRDEIGIYCRVDGWIARPVNNATLVSEGDELQATHPPGPFAYVRLKGAPKEHRSRWQVECMWWWHPAEGRGGSAAGLRADDIARNPSLCSEKGDNQPDHVKRFWRNSK